MTTATRPFGIWLRCTDTLTRDGDAATESEVGRTDAG